MRSMLVHAILPWFERSRLFAAYTLTRRGFLKDVGWFESVVQKRAVDARGGPIPWITYPCLSFLAHRIRPEFDIFEYGCGNSTLWWAERVCSVVSCEHDPAWYNEFSSKVGTTVSLHHRPLDQDYAGFVVMHPGRFDVIVIDGRERNACMRRAADALKPRGVILVDNSDLPEYRPGLDVLGAQGFRHIDFDGPGPISAAGWRTSIFYRQENCLGI